MFKIRYKSHHDVGNVISKLVKSEKATKDDFINILNSPNTTKQLGIYFHTPYCDKICSFCNMNREKLETDLEDYTNYICDEIKKYSKYEFCKSSEIDVVFFGGGTPTVYNANQLERILKTLREHFKFKKEYEMTFETTLHNLSLDKIKIMEKYGVNRISVGVQTFSDRGRKLLNRTYNKNYVVKRLKELKQIFSGHICIDIIYNYADQTDDEVLEDAKLLSEIGVASTSFYSLMIHDGSEISKMRKMNKDVYIYSLDRDEHLHNLFYEKCIENGYKLLELTKMTNGEDNYLYIRNNNSSKNLLPIGIGAGGNIQGIGCYNFNKQMSFYSKASARQKNLSMISGMMQFDKFKIKDFEKYCESPLVFKKVFRKFKEYEELGYIKIKDDYIYYEPKGIFWGNSIAAEIIKELFKFMEEVENRMKTLIVYSTISGNTKAVCERIYGALKVDKKIINVEDISQINTDEYENIIVGFWCDKGTMDKKSLEFVKSLKNKKLYFLGTLGARPNSDHWKDVFENAKKICQETNEYKDGLLIWGRISQELQDRMMKMPKDHFHGPTEERIARWKAASTHPDENDFKEAENFFSNLLNN